MSINRESIKVASLYIGDLHPEVTEAMLFEKFSAVGPILSIRICRDKITRKSLSYAYVNFQNYMDAEKALETMNFDIVKEKPIRIMWYQKDSSLRKSGVGNIFIKNLDKSIDNKFMYKIFSVFGNILSCKIVVDEKGHSKEYGFAHFEREEMANKAISEINGKLINGKKVYVGKFISRDQREKYINNNIYTFSNIFIKNFDETMDDDKLKKLFEKYGNITSAKVMMNENGKSKGFGFVNFENSANAIKAIEEMNGKEFYGKILFVGWAIKKLNRENEARRKFEQQKLEKIRYSQGLNLLIKNLDDSIDDEYLAKEFLPFGTITSAKVMTNMNGNSRGFGFVCFSSPEEANRAKAEMNGKMLASKPLYVTVASKKVPNKTVKTSRYLERIPEIYMQPSFFQIQSKSSRIFISSMSEINYDCFSMHMNPVDEISIANSTLK